MKNSGVFCKAWYLVLVLTLTACGGGGGGSSTPEPDPEPTPDPDPVAVSGGGVKGPLANAIVTVYAYDPGQANFQGAVVDTATTDAAAAITGLALPFPVSPPYIMEFTSDGGTTDITTGLAPVITTLRTVITQTLLDKSEQIYATPLTTMAVDIAISNSNSSTTAEQFETALAAAATQVISTVGFGMSGDIDIFDVPPLIDSTTATTEEQEDVAAYRTAVEALTAVVFQMEQQSTGGSVDAVLSELTEDLSDGEIDGIVDGTASTIFTSTTLDVLEQDPATLPIPNDPLNQTVANVQAILVSETATTGSTTSTTDLGDGTITTVVEPAETDPDSDGDGVLNVDDVFPDDATESTDADGDGVGDVADTDDDNDGILDEDEGVAVVVTGADADGDGFDDGADNCPAIFNPAQTNTDGQMDGGDACDTDDDDDMVLDTADLFPLDGTEDSDADGDGIGDTADTDDDNDGLLDTAEDSAAADPDADGIPNREDTDSDNDGVFDSVDYAPYDDMVTFNNAPVSNDSSVTTNEDTAAPFVLDSADDGVAAGALVYDYTGPTSGALTGTEPNLTYTPTANFNGSDVFTYTVTDGDGKISNVATVTITVTSINDDPVVDAVGPFSIAENASNTSPVGTVTASDIESSITGFTIASGNTGSAFAIDANGAITVADTNAIDYESSISFTLGITASDGSATSAVQNVTIDINNVNDSAPVITPVGPFSIDEDLTNGSAVGSVVATPTDILSVVNAYNIIAGNTGSAFAIDTSGNITVADTSAIDFEDSTSFSLTITASDSVNVSASEIVVVNITDANDTDPIVDTAQSFSVAEDAINTTTVGTVTASDIDTVGSITGFAITSGNTGSAFAIDSSGVITVIDTSAINYEASTSFTLAITATDGTNTSSAENVSITVDDANDSTPVVDASQTFNVSEDDVNTTTVGTVTASDADTDTSITGYSITGGNTGSAFAIDASGVITVIDASAIDYESSTSFTLAITATDGANTSSAENVTIDVDDVNDTAPEVDTAQVFAIAENIADASPVGIVTAADVDTVGSITGYSITGGDTGGAFSIASNGQITVADTDAIDYESDISFTLTVTATDSINVSAGETVTVTINDVNDTAPVVDAVGPFALPENSIDTTAVGTVTATDVDTVGSVTGYTITGGNTGSAFTIDSGGAITVATTAALNREVTPTFTLTITATDSINTSVAQSVVINLSDLNDTAPVIASSQIFGVDSSAANSTVVGTVSASDADTTGAITGFSITLGNTGSAFAIDSAGEITVIDNTNLLTNSPYTLTLTATDGTNTSATETVGITVTTGGAVWGSFNWDDGSTWQ